MPYSTTKVPLRRHKEHGIALFSCRPYVMMFTNHKWSNKRPGGFIIYQRKTRLHVLISSTTKFECRGHFVAGCFVEETTLARRPFYVNINKPVH